MRNQWIRCDVRLTAEDIDGNVASVTRCFQMNGEAKGGNFSVSFEDLTIPVAGILITITRTYDSRVKSTGDFGVGWNLSFSDFRLEESEAPGAGWQAVCRRSHFGTCLEYGVEPTRLHSVVITSPDGQVDEFEFSAQTFGGLSDFLIPGNLILNSKPETVSSLQALNDTAFDVQQSGQLQDFSFNVVDPNGNTITLGAGNGDELEDLEEYLIELSEMQNCDFRSLKFATVGDVVRYYARMVRE